MPQLSDALDGPSPLLLPELALPAQLRIVVLAPHPDDFDAIGLSLRFLHRQGHVIHVAVVTAGASGVEDGCGGAHTVAQKAALREAEQRASCAYFGLAPDRLAFLRLWEGGDDATDRERLRDYLRAKQPQLVFMPHGNDTNRTHRRVYESFDAIAKQDGLSLWALLNRDAKTISMRADLYTYFGEEDARWKAELLRFHRSQQERNLRTRGQGFDERVLAMNRESARLAGAALPYAECFELRRYG